MAGDKRIGTRQDIKIPHIFSIVGFDTKVLAIKVDDRSSVITS
jgi:hypothetical protein